LKSCFEGVSYTLGKDYGNGMPSKKSRAPGRCLKEIKKRQEALQVI
jgi:hypothetical protein